MKFKEYPNSTSLADNDAFIIDGDDGTKHILTPDAAMSLIGSISPEVHSRIFRGKNLGTSVTAAQKAAIKDGSFDDLFLGDYWVIDGVNWRIVDMDYWYNIGEVPLMTHHLVIMPDTILYEAMMNHERTTCGGYTDSDMRITNLEQAKTIIASAFGDMVLTHVEYLSNYVTDGVVTGVAYTDSSVELPNEIMMYGTNIFSPINDGTLLFHSYTFCRAQLALFAIAPKFIGNTRTYWLRDVASSDCFACVDLDNSAAYRYSDVSCGVRPVFSIF